MVNSSRYPFVFILFFLATFHNTNKLAIRIFIYYPILMETNPSFIMMKDIKNMDFLPYTIKVPFMMSIGINNSLL